MHIFLTGATGFVGSYVLDALLEQGHTVRCLVRNPDSVSLPADESVETVKGDATRRKSLVGLLRGCDAVIHLIGIIKEIPSRSITFEALHYEATKNVVEASFEAGISTFIHMSANGASPEGVSGYQTSKWKAEEYVRNAGFERWTIFRPSVIFGRPKPGQPEFASQLTDSLIVPFPVWPVFGDGTYRMQPVAVEDVADAFVQALDLDAAKQQTYCVAGPASYAYTELLDIIAEGKGIDPKPQIKQPIWIARPAIHGLGRFGLLPITPDQFEMLIEGNICDPTKFYTDFELQRIPFTTENLEYLRD